jgi:hypothetical protein
MRNFIPKSKRLAQLERVFELLDETPEKINSVRDLATIEKNKRAMSLSRM